MPTELDSVHGTADVFRTTRWSVVLTAGRKDAPGKNEALSELCRTYWYPLYVYLRRRGHEENEAKDLTQQFLSRLVEKDFLSGIKVEGARFRSFLLTALKRFAVNEWQKSQALKRGGGCKVVSLDQESPEARYQFEPADTNSPDLLYERRWAMTVIEETIGRLEAEYKRWRKGWLFDCLQTFLVDSGESASYAEIAAQVGMTTGAVKVAVHRLKRRYGELLRESIAQTVSDPAEVDDEIRHLIAILAR